MEEKEVEEIQEKQNYLVKEIMIQNIILKNSVNICLVLKKMKMT